MNQLPRSLRVLTAAEQRFFRRTKIKQLQNCKVLQKVQWIDTARSIITGFRENLYTNPQARIMWNTMNLTTEEQKTESESKNENNDKSNVVYNQLHDNNRTTQETNTQHTQEENKIIHEKTDQREQTDSKQHEKELMKYYYKMEDR